MARTMYPSLNYIRHKKANFSVLSRNNDGSQLPFIERFGVFIMLAAAAMSELFTPWRVLFPHVMVTLDYTDMNNGKADRPKITAKLVDLPVWQKALVGIAAVLTFPITLLVGGLFFVLNHLIHKKIMGVDAAQIEPDAPSEDKDTPPYPPEEPAERNAHDLSLQFDAALNASIDDDSVHTPSYAAAPHTSIPAAPQRPRASADRERTPPPFSMPFPVTPGPAAQPLTSTPLSRTLADLSQDNAIGPPESPVNESFAAGDTTYEEQLAAAIAMSINENRDVREADAEMSHHSDVVVGEADDRALLERNIINQMMTVARTATTLANLPSLADFALNEDRTQLTGRGITFNLDASNVDFTAPFIGQISRYHLQTADSTLNVNIFIPSNPEHAGLVLLQNGDVVPSIVGTFGPEAPTVNLFQDLVAAHPAAVAQPHNGILTLEEYTRLLDDNLSVSAGEESTLAESAEASAVSLASVLGDAPLDETTSDVDDALASAADQARQDAIRSRRLDHLASVSPQPEADEASDTAADEAKDNRAFTISQPHDATDTEVLAQQATVQAGLNPLLNQAARATALRELPRVTIEQLVNLSTEEVTYSLNVPGEEVIQLRLTLREDDERDVNDLESLQFTVPGLISDIRYNLQTGLVSISGFEGDNADHAQQMILGHHYRHLDAFEHILDMNITGYENGTTLVHAVQAAMSTAAAPVLPAEPEATDAALEAALAASMATAEAEKAQAEQEAANLEKAIADSLNAADIVADEEEEEEEDEESSLSSANSDENAPVVAPAATVLSREERLAKLEAARVAQAARITAAELAAAEQEEDTEETATEAELQAQRDAAEKERMRQKRLARFKAPEAPQAAEAADASAAVPFSMAPPSQEGQAARMQEIMRSFALASEPQEPTDDHEEASSNSSSAPFLPLSKANSSGEASRSSTVVPAHHNNTAVLDGESSSSNTPRSPK